MLNKLLIKINKAVVMFGLRGLILVFVILQTLDAFRNHHWTTKLKSLKPKVAPAEGRIVGGQEVVPHSYPFIAGLYIDYGTYFCSGSLISENYVLTAAHCGVVMSQVDVVFGAHNIKNASESTQVVISSAEVIVHEDYNGTSYLNDIALIKLASSVRLNENIKIAKLPAKNQELNNRETVTAVGWGLTYDTDYPSVNNISPILKSVNVSIMDNGDCKDVYNDEIPYVTSNNICTSGYRNRGTCEGDSGGPLVSKDGTLIGVVSFGDTVCEECSPSVYVDVSKFLEWIEKHSDVKID